VKKQVLLVVGAVLLVLAVAFFAARATITSTDRRVNEIERDLRE
jgi:hypothetical protein